MKLLSRAHSNDVHGTKKSIKLLMLVCLLAVSSVQATLIQNITAEETTNNEVVDTSMSVVINTPLEETINVKTLRISATPSQIATHCNYSIDGIASGSLNQGTEEWFELLPLNSDGIYDLTVSCSAETERASSNRMFRIDATAPTITTKEPKRKFTGNPVQLKIATNENSFCKYSESNIYYDAMPDVFSQTGGTDHLQIVEAAAQKDVTYYVACEDRHGNKMAINEQLSLLANPKSTVKIIIEKNNDIEDSPREGAYQIELETSENAINPILAYALSSDEISRSVMLTKSKLGKFQNDLTGHVIDDVKDDESFLNKAILLLGLITVLSLLAYHVVYISDVAPRNTYVIAPQKFKSISQLSSRRMEQPLRHHVARAHNYADEIRYQEALSLYKDILIHLEKSKTLDRKGRKIIERETEDLYKKLMIISYINKAHSAIDARNANNLKNAMQGIKKNYYSLRKNSELSQHARKSYDYFMSHLKKSDKEKFFNDLKV